MAEETSYILTHTGEQIDAAIDQTETNRQAIATKAPINHTHSQYVEKVTGKSLISSDLDKLTTANKVTAGGGMSTVTFAAAVTADSISDGTNTLSNKQDKSDKLDLLIEDAQTIDDHVFDDDIHVSDTDRTNWNAASTHASSTHAPSDAQKNVQSDWNATSGDVYIKNKPNINGNSLNANSTTESLGILYNRTSGQTFAVNYCKIKRYDDSGSPLAYPQYIQQASEESIAPVIITVKNDNTELSFSISSIDTITLYKLYKNTDYVYDMVMETAIEYGNTSIMLSKGKYVLDTLETINYTLSHSELVAGDGIKIESGTKISVSNLNYNSLINKPTLFDPLVVNVTQSSAGTWSADKTYSELQTAKNLEKAIFFNVRTNIGLIFQSFASIREASFTVFFAHGFYDSSSPYHYVMQYTPSGISVFSR